MFRDRDEFTGSGGHGGHDDDWVDFPPSPDEPTQMPARIGTTVLLPPAPAQRAGSEAGTSRFVMPEAETSPKRRSPLRLIAISAALAAALAGAGYFGFQWWTTGRFMVSTDDAYVGASSATIAAKIPGYLAALAVDDNQQVHAGDVIATIDDGDYRLAVDAARDKVATQTATIDRIAKQVTAQQAMVDQAKAQLASAQAGATRAQLELDRQQALASRAYASRQALEQAQAERDQTVAAVNSAQAALESATANVDVLKGQQEEANAHPQGARYRARQGRTRSLLCGHPRAV